MVIGFFQVSEDYLTHTNNLLELIYAQNHGIILRDKFKKKRYIFWHLVIMVPVKKQVFKS